MLTNIYGKGMVGITFLGGAREVGRMGILLESRESRILWEYGVNVQTMDVPTDPGTNLDGVFVTHAHLDHSGCVPVLYKEGYKGNVYATPPTFELMSLLLRDAVKVQKKKGLQPQFLPHDIEKTERMRKTIKFGQTLEFGRDSVTAYSAGHIPGAASYLFESEGKRILFTGDIKFIGTKLVGPAFSGYKDIDVLITESTYSYKNHPDREETLDKLREAVQETLYNNGIALLPAFAVGRTQELLINLSDLGFSIYLDGMGIEATDRMLAHPKYLSNPSLLRRAFSRAHKIERQSERNRIVKKPCVIITTAGMMNGGPVSFYMKKLHDREDCSLLLTGYMVEGTVGRTLMDTGRYMNGEIDVEPKMRMEFFDLSAHTDRQHIIEFIEKTEPKRIMLVHGDHNPEFEKFLRSRGFDAHAPRMGESVEV